MSFRSNDPWPYDGSFGNSQEPDFKSVTDNFNSSFKWAATASIISALIGTVAIVAIVYAIIICLKKAGDAIPAYSRVSDTDNISKQHVFSASTDSDTVKINIPSNFPIVSNSRIEAVTMERFIEEIAKEKPIRFTPQQLEGFTNNYEVVLGSGGYGVVYKGVFPNGELIAVKVLNKNSTKKIEQQFMAEVSTIGRTYHHNLVKLYGFCFDPSMTALVYECMENGSLDKYLFGEEKVIEWEALHKIAIGTAKGIAYLHEECGKKIIHYDIKPENVLLDVEFSPKVADFGLAKLCNRASTHVAMTGCKGTPGYAAPELWQPYPVTQKCDVYSFGMMLFEIVGRRRNLDADLDETSEWLPRWIWENFKNETLGKTMEVLEVDERVREMAERMSVIALWCVQYMPEARPIMSSVVKMLEGADDISPPPNPFEHLEVTAVNLEGSNQTSSVSGSSLSSTTQFTETSNSIPMKNIFQIEKTSL